MFQIKKHKLKYFADIWNWLDMAIILICLVCVAFNIYRTYEVITNLAGHRRIDYDLHHTYGLFVYSYVPKINFCL